MSRPELPTLSSGLAGWDSLIDDIVEILTQRPMPIARIADTATLNATYDPGQYEDCIIMVQGPTKGLYSSDGTNWIPI